MANTLQFEAAMKSASDVWGLEPVQNIRMPMLENQCNVITAEVDALWTDGGLRPNANNLAFLMQSIANENELKIWEQRLKTLPVRGSLLISPNDLYLVQPQSNTSSELEIQRLNLETWYTTLNTSKPHLFTPKALSRFRQGQLSLADLEETVSERSLIFFTRQQAQINNAFRDGINAALNVIEVPNESNSSRSEIKGHIIRYGIAYLAARILQDKNFFGSGTSIYSEDQDPRTLLNWMVDKTNGFFKRTMEESAPHIHELVREQLANHMGVYRVSFALTDHRDVGTLYERAIKRLPPPKDLSGKEWSDLNRHYTPVKIAERMLEALPLERLRPEERYIFDPAAGSGSLLLAATSRLAGMTDIPTGMDRKAYLENYVAGNDRDEYAKLITKLRYFLASESLGRLDEQITNVLPFPSEKNFTCNDYEILSRDSLPIKPKVIVANPPFSEEGNTQKATKFVQKALEWLDNGSQFAFVLPQSFLAGTTHGFSQARDLIAERCQILEVWQVPEGSVGINAQQAVCVVLGLVGQTQKIFPVSSKAVFSRVKEEVKTIRDHGFLGASWINYLHSSNLEYRNQFWQFAVAPPISIRVPTILLGELFYIFNGVTPLTKIYPPESKQLFGIPYKRYWQLRHRDTSKFWADPEIVPKSEIWIRYGKEYLRQSCSDNETLFDISKVLIARKVNRGSNYPLAAQFDDVGFCPNNNVFCVLPAVDVNKYTSGYQLPNKLPNEWISLNYKDKCLWLIGICSSRIANSLSLIGRKTREITVDELCRLPLPFEVDLDIVEVTRQIINLEKRRDLSLETQINSLRQNLNQLVKKSYGNPSWKEIARVGKKKSAELEAWEREQKKTTKTAIGQVLEISEDNTQVRMYISRLMDDDDTEGEWVPIPQELPGWSLDGTPFEVQLSNDVRTFEQLKERPWALRSFRHTPRPYLTDEELDEFLEIPDLEGL